MSLWRPRGQEPRPVEVWSYVVLCVVLGGLGLYLIWSKYGV